jgi:hypothetical protein
MPLLQNGVHHGSEEGNWRWMMCVRFRAKAMTLHFSHSFYVSNLYSVIRERSHKLHKHSQCSTSIRLNNGHRLQCTRATVTFLATQEDCPQIKKICIFDPSLSWTIAHFFRNSNMSSTHFLPTRGLPQVSFCRMRSIQGPLLPKPIRSRQF